MKNQRKKNLLLLTLVVVLLGIGITLTRIENDSWKQSINTFLMGLGWILVPMPFFLKRKQKQKSNG